VAVPFTRAARFRPSSSHRSGPSKNCDTRSSSSKTSARENSRRALSSSGKVDRITATSLISGCTSAESAAGKSSRTTVRLEITVRNPRRRARTVYSANRPLVSTQPSIVGARLATSSRRIRKHGLRHSVVT
jgi:hypothetical protein